MADKVSDVIKRNNNVWPNRPPQEKGLEDAGFLPFDLDEYLNIRGLGKKALSKLMRGLTTNQAAAVKNTRKFKEKYDAARKVKSEAAKAKKMTANSELGTMKRGDDPKARYPGATFEGGDEAKRMRDK